MKAERWRQIDELLEAALQREPSHRKQFLEAACGDDESLRREVESLLDAHDRAGSFIETAPLDQAAELLAQQEAQATVGQSFAHYRIEAPLGRGGMGEVYLAQDTKLQRKVAIKLLPRRMVDNEKAKQRLVREARAAAKLEHPNICAVHEVGEQEGIHYIVMQYVAGEPLAAKLKAGPLAPPEALDIAAQIAEALSEAHSRGIIHRDIKPQNVMVTRRGQVKVLDFGLAKLVEQASSAPDHAQADSILTQPGVVIGTLPYMSPEQASGDPIDYRSDLFSLGALLYECLTGKRVFAAATPMETCAKVLQYDPPSPSHYNPRVPAEINSLMLKALDKKPARRYQSAEEMLIDLRKARARLVELDQDRTQEQLPSLTGIRKIRTAVTSRLRLLVITALLAAAALATVYWLATKPARPSRDQAIASLKQVRVLNWKDQGGALEVSHGVLSPDGKVIAYSSRETGRSSVRIKQTNEGISSPLVSDDWSNWSPVWSADGQEVAFFSTRGNRLGVWRVAAISGTPVQIISIDLAENPDAQNAELRYWSKDGGTLYYNTTQNLFSIDVATKKITQLTNFDPAVLISRFFSVSPGEDRIAYNDVVDGQRDIWVMPINGGQPTRITNDAAEDVSPVWHPDARRILYSSKRDGIFQVCVGYLDGRSPYQITFGDDDSFVSDVSADGKRILYSSSREESDIWAVRADTGEESQITSDVGDELWSDVSPDGNYIAFQAVRQVSQSLNFDKSLLMVKALHTDRGLTQLAAGAIEARWSPDNQRLAFLRVSELSNTIWTVSAVGGDEKQLSRRSISGFVHSILPYNRFNTCDFSWSPDSRQISYGTDDPQPGLWVTSVDGRADLNIAEAAGESTKLSSPIWSPDGAHIAYLSTDEGAAASWSVGVADAKGGGTRVVYQAGSVLRLLGWMSDNTLLVATIADKATVWPSPARVKLLRVFLYGGNSFPVAELDSTYLYSTRLSPDGQFVAFVSRRAGKGNIGLVPTQGGPPKWLTENTDPKLYFSSISWSPDATTIYFDKQSRYSLIYLLTNFE